MSEQRTSVLTHSSLAGKSCLLESDSGTGFVIIVVMTTVSSIT
jgi:hypothetical protein